LNLPFDGGMNVTVTVQVPAGAIALIHSFPPSWKPVPITFTNGAGSSTLPLLVSVTGRAVLTVPAGTLPKLIFFADNPTVSLFFVAAGLDCALARSLRTDRAAQAAVRTAIDRRT
jgi:hypothetical protein